MDFHFSWLKNSCTGICPGNCENIGWIESILCVNAHMIKYRLAQYFQKSTLVTIPLSEKVPVGIFLPKFLRAVLKYSWDKMCSLCAATFSQRTRFEPFDLYFPLELQMEDSLPVSSTWLKKFLHKNLPRIIHEIIGCTNSIFLCKCAHD